MNTYTVEIMSNALVATDTYKMVLYCPSIVCEEFLPGQFAHIEIPNAKHLTLRRPISIASVKNEKMTLIYKVLGEGTKLMSTLNPKDKINILTSIGKGFVVPKTAKNVYLVGGGLGCAPLQSIVEEQPEYDYTAFLGYATADYAFSTDVMEALCEKVIIATDDGSLGYKGNSIQALKEHLKTNTPDIILACGPTPMAKALKKLVEEANIPCQISLEERMGCGFGACLVCVCKLNQNGKEAFKRVCVDGPVFDIRQVSFDD